jgi:hypothetical protein
MSPDERSWARDGLPPEARHALASGLPASEVWSLLLGVMEARASRRTPASLRDQWERDRFVQLCQIDQRSLVEMDGHLLAAASAFEAVELSPLAPLGVCAAVALASQNKIVSTTRGTEVVSDPTNVLALECARRMRENGFQPVRLTTCHRVTRAQAVPKRPGFAAHFRMFCLASAGHERENREFQAGELIQHINTQLAALDRLERNGYSFPGRTVRILVTPANTQLAERIGAAIRSAPVEHQALDHAYYDGIRFMIDVRAPNGAEIPLIDGGAFSWLRTLLSNGKIAFVASGMGSQVAASLFRGAR